MFAIMYNTEDGKVFKIFQNLEDAQATANNIASAGINVTVFDYDMYAETFVEFYTI